MRFVKKVSRNDNKRKRNIGRILLHWSYETFKFSLCPNVGTQIELVGRKVI